MTKTRLDGLYLMLLGSLALALLGTVLSNTSTVGMIDFRAMYYPAQCLLQHCDPYSESQVLSLARAEGGELPSDHDNANHFARYLYLPPTFSFTVPFAMLPWGPAHILWMVLTGSGFILAGFLMWNSGADGSPVIAGALIGFFLANSELLMVVGNIAGLSIVLCVIAVWCFVRERFVLAGILCFAISLAIKPHDSGLVWLYFLLAGGVYTRRALQTLLATAAIQRSGAPIDLARRAPLASGSSGQHCSRHGTRRPFRSNRSINGLAWAQHARQPANRLQCILEQSAHL